MKKMRLLVFFFGWVVFFSVSAQDNSALLMRSMKTKSGTVCYLDQRNAYTNIPPPASYYERLAGNGRTKTANIEVTYEGFTLEAQSSFQNAVDIWETFLVSSVPIHILARWAPLGEGVLGGAQAGSYFINFDGAQKNNVWYPVSLAEKMARKDLNDTDDPDIVATFNANNNNWHYGQVDVAPPPGKYDLMSVVLHEIGHGLGITHAYAVAGNDGVLGEFFGGAMVTYETFLEASDGRNIVTTFEVPSTDLGLILRSNALFFNAPLVKLNNSNERAKVFAPAVYSPGSSIAHLDESTYPAGTPNSLMTPNIAAAERNLNPGPVVLNILKEMGWINTHIQHSPLASTENTASPYEVICKILGDNTYDPATVKLNYSANGGAMTTVVMTATGTANQFKADIPNGGNKFKYFISVVDADLRIFTKPGTAYKTGAATVQNTFSFEAGPDTKPPVINHVPQEFISTGDPFKLEAVVSDNLGVDRVNLVWKVNGVDKPDLDFTLKAGTDSTYVVEAAPASTFVNGDKILYRIIATDDAAVPNKRTLPAGAAFFEVNVSGLLETQASYLNDFNTLSAADFFGNGFSVTKPAGFENGAIHSDHPYLEGNGAPGERRDFIYTLKVPIKVKAQEAFIKFDEIVLVEPGEAGSVFGDENFFDYVVVEGSIDGGVTWKALEPGYDARDKADWLTRYNSAITANNSTAVGDPSLFRSRVMDMLKEFDAGDELAIRFRLFSDPFAAGWGWAIDNLRIQVDEQPPTIKHQHVDHIMTSATQIEIKTKASDAAGLDKIFIDHKVNTGTVTTAELLIDPTTDQYTFTIPLTALNLKAGDDLQYRIRARDKAGNEGTLPASGFIQVAVLSLANPVLQFVSDFNTPGTDISGNYFEQVTPTGFANGAVHSAHPYLSNIGLDDNSNFTWVIKKPIKVNGNNPYIVFDEIAVTEYAGTAVKDYVVIEGSKDGITWEKIIDEHSANFESKWKVSFDNSGTPNTSLYLNRIVILTANGKFKADDVILMRFRLFSDATKTGWGLGIDNLSIQGPITGLEKTVDETVSVYPNPVSGDHIYVRAESLTGPIVVRVLSASGASVRSEQFTVNGTDDHEVFVGDLADGLYVLRLESAARSATAKFLRRK